MKSKYAFLKILLPVSFLFVVGFVFIGYTMFHKKTYLYTDDHYVSIAQYLQNSGDIAEAVCHYKKALEVNPRNSKACFALGGIEHSRKRYDMAIDYFKKVTSLKPNNSSYFLHLGFTQYNQGCITDAIQSLEKAIRLNPANFPAYKWLGFSYLMVGQLDKGYAVNDAVHKMKAAKGMRDNEWTGGDLQGKTVLVMDNIGVGDVFCFLRYFEALKQKGARVVFGTRKYIVPILSRCPYIDAFVQRYKEVPKFDTIISMDNMPSVAHKYFKDFKADGPYLRAEPALVKKWNQKLSSDRNFKIGICWHSAMYKNAQTGKLQKNKRAMPLHYFYALNKMNGVSLYSLQQVHGTEQVDHMPLDFDIHTFDKTFDKEHGSFMDTAAVMKNLDLVITVDTSIAHLAGALGVPVWVMLPYVPDWRWLLGRSDTDLYPTMRLFRQAKLDDWESAMQQIMSELGILVQKKNKEEQA